MNTPSVRVMVACKDLLQALQHSQTPDAEVQERMAELQYEARTLLQVYRLRRPSRTTALTGANAALDPPQPGLSYVSGGWAASRH